MQSGEMQVSKMRYWSLSVPLVLFPAVTRTEVDNAVHHKSVSQLSSHPLNIEAQKGLLKSPHGRLPYIYVTWVKVKLKDSFY